MLGVWPGRVAVADMSTPGERQAIEMGKGSPVDFECHQCDAMAAQVQALTEERDKWKAERHEMARMADAYLAQSAAKDEAPTVSSNLAEVEGFLEHWPYGTESHDWIMLQIRNCHARIQATRQWLEGVGK